MQAYCRPHISPETTEVIYEINRSEIDLQIVFFSAIHISFSINLY